MQTLFSLLSLKPVSVSHCPTLANSPQVLEEVKRPEADPNRVYRRAAKLTVFMVTFFYIMVNVSLVSADSFLGLFLFYLLIG
jgi:hypothetical protein